MSANFGLAAISGLAGSAAMLILIYILVGAGYQLDIPYLLGTRHTPPDRRGRAYLIGFLLFFLIGALWGMIYVTLMIGLVEPPKWTIALLYGAGHGFFAGVLLSTYADSHPHVGSDKVIPDPGMFGNRWGKSVPFLIVLLHLVYALVTIMIYNELYHPEQFPHV